MGECVGVWVKIKIVHKVEVDVEYTFEVCF